MERDLKRRKAFAANEAKRQLLRAEIRKSTTMTDRMMAVAALDECRGPSVRIGNRCTYTGRSKGVYKSWRMSRIIFREKALAGQLPGVQKASW